MFSKSLAIVAIIAAATATSAAAHTSNWDRGAVRDAPAPTLRYPAHYVARPYHSVPYRVIPHRLVVVPAYRWAPRPHRWAPAYRVVRPVYAYPGYPNRGAFFGPRH